MVRFKELQREIPDISQKMLTVTLRTLEDDGYVTRTVYPEVPPRVEYALTERTRSLLPHINALIEWALENKDAIIKGRKRSHPFHPGRLRGCRQSMPRDQTHRQRRSGMIRRLGIPWA